MRKNQPLKILTLALTLTAVATLAAAEPTTWEVDTAHSQVGFSVRHFFTPVNGRFNEFSGTIVHDPENPAASSVEFTVQAASIDTNNERRDGHLRSEDFFHVEEHPTLSFQSTSVSGEGSDLSVTGEFTLRGVTKTITVPVTYLGSMGDKAGFSTEFTIDRKEYGIVWNRMLDQGGAMLADEVKIEIAVEADRKE